MDKIILKNAHYSANLGITKKEKQFVQPVIMDIVITPTANTIPKASRIDDIKSTINYSEINRLIQRTLDKLEFKLIETLAETIVQLLLIEFPIRRIELTVKKPQALKNVEYTAVSICREKE